MKSDHLSRIIFPQALIVIVVRKPGRQKLIHQMIFKKPWRGVAAGRRAGFRAYILSTEKINSLKPFQKLTDW
jgi:hypothetical protein